MSLAVAAADAAAAGQDQRPPRSSGLERRVVEGALRCFGRWGVTKTTVDDIAREAGVSRATVYRVFPAGRDSILDAVVDAERREFFERLGTVLAEASNLEDLILSGFTFAWKHLGNDAVLTFLVEHEPEVVLRNLAFERLESLIAVCRETVAPHVERWLDPVRSARLAEWATRVVVSYAVAPPEWSPRPHTAREVDAWAEQLAHSVVSTFFAPVLARWTGTTHEPVRVPD